MTMDAGAVEFALIAEAGPLEAQAVLLCESIRRFGGALAQAQITVVSPRAQRRPSARGISALERLHVEYLALDIDSCCPEYGTSWRVHAAALIEQRSGPDVLIQLDSDTIFVSEPDPAWFAAAATARPVDVKGMCTTGAEDPLDPYWRDLCALAEVDYDRMPIVHTTVDRVAVRASYNGGFVAVRRELGLLAATEEIFRRLIGADMHSWTADGPLMRTGTGYLSGRQTAFWGTSQAAFSLAAVARDQEVRLLPATCNFPGHSLDQMQGPTPSPLVHLHYHWLFAEANAIEHVENPRLALSAEAREWLRAKLPLIG